MLADLQEAAEFPLITRRMLAKQTVPQVEVEVEIPRETPIGQPLSRGSGSAGLSDLEKQTRVSCLLIFPRSSSDRGRQMPEGSRSRYRWGLR
ncbi:hypothetical protein BO83DRAFT_402887 [Aspergillus eucalypticola CBS 122712]|uniref:Uncharacterized protein n=1 Tax=Aspergillus eucalypticola (strain CBS 122712 / IBT 29274) TaxID=1448314 RepID=A0A317URE1_ASPEC|nr:uncharacterized protein BO83DRAFT_402887 [Aspergillus eucalypticola CBS 122712]PWY63776.1 hypothetical protein BO83DRAFT_402887 [Aspergillus eucalypticola CBS 122712]